MGGPSGAGKSAPVAAVLPKVGDLFGSAAFVDLSALTESEALARVQSALADLPARRTARTRTGLWDPELLLLNHADVLARSAARLAAMAAGRRRDDRGDVGGDDVEAPVEGTDGGGPVPGAVDRDGVSGPAALARPRPRSRPADDRPGGGGAGRAGRGGAGSPLVLELLAARLERDPLDVLVREVEAAPTALDALVPTGPALPEVLSVFGTADVAAAAAVGGLSEAEVLEQLTPLLALRLVRIADASLVMSDRPAYRLPGMVRGCCPRAVGRSRSCPGPGPEAHRALRRDSSTGGPARHPGQGPGLVDVIRGRYHEARAALDRLSEQDTAAALRTAVDLLPEAERRGEKDVVAARIEQLVQDRSLTPSLRSDALVALINVERKTPDSVQRAPLILARLEEALAPSRQAECLDT